MLEKYRFFEARLKAIRMSPAAKELVEVYGLDFTPEEDFILDQMDAAWQLLTDEEQKMLRDEDPQCW
jgi:hypothetical protein